MERDQDKAIDRRHFDAVIIGAGPAGSSCAALLAEQGLSVLVCEREAFPRFHVGESLLPRGNAVLERLGVLEQCRERGWTVKHGASFLHATAQPDQAADGETSEGLQPFCSIRFDEALGRAEPSAFQVPRAEFDQMLLERARELGAEVRQPCAVREVEFSPEGALLELSDVALDGGVVTERGSHGERATPGSRTTVSASFVVDASGQSGFLAKRLNLRQSDPALRNVASFAHFEDWNWPAAIAPGDIQVISLDTLGWLWLIPLSRDRVSVGLVEATGSQRGRASREERLHHVLASTPVLAVQARQARRVSDVYSLADFGYRAKHYCGGRWLLAGDAGSFVDPVFSTGVYLALSSGAEAADAIVTVLAKGGVRARRVLQRYERTQRRRYEFFRRFVLRFYRPGMRDLLCQRREVLGMPRALSTTLAGEWRPSWSVRWRLEAFYLLAWLQERTHLVQRLHGVMPWL